MKFNMFAFLLVFSCVSFCQAGETAPALPAPYTPSDSNQLMTLGESATPRFKLTEISWPAEPGQGEVCLWKNDAYAACSLCIDDNNAWNHVWWREICAKYSIKVTFFVITGGVDGPSKVQFGSWDDWRAMHAAGIDVESHSVNHSGGDDTNPVAFVNAEYAGSKQSIEKEIPGHRCLTMGYPCGRGRSDLAAGYFIAVRGASATPSPANQINYLNTGIGNVAPEYVNTILGCPPKNCWLDNPIYRRGWIQPTWHSVSDATNAESAIANIVARRDQLWIDTFTSVAIYGQERDSATLKTIASGPDRIELALADRMRDDIFDQPLTLKVRLPDSWTGVTARQKGATVAARLVQHEGHPYALVQAVPDRGPIVLARQE